MENQKIEIIIEPASEKYDKHDPRWQDQEADLITDLRREADKVEKHVEPVPGMKGGIETILVTLIPALIPAVTEVIKAWMGRDKGRKLTATIKIDGKPVEVNIDANGLDKETFKKIVTQHLLENQ